MAQAVRERTSVKECEHCSKSHRTDDAVEKCKARAERAAVLLAKREAEAERRALNQQGLPWELRVRRMRREGQRWDQVASYIKKNYPTDVPTDLWSIALAYARQLNWPIADEVVAQSLLEKWVTGDYISFHPMQLKAVQDSFTAAGAVMPRTPEREELIADS